MYGVIIIAQLNDKKLIKFSICIFFNLNTLNLYDEWFKSKDLVELFGSKTYLIRVDLRRSWAVYRNRNKVDNLILVMNVITNGVAEF